MGRKIAGLLVVIIAVLLIWWRDKATWTFQAAAKQESRAAAEESSQTHASEVRTDLGEMNDQFKRSGFDPKVFRKRLLTNALVTNEGRAAYEEARATADGLTIGTPAQVLQPYTYGPQTRIPFLGPLTITLEGRVCSRDGREVCSEPEGIDWRPTGATLVAPNARYLAAIWRVCNAPDNCTPWEQGRIWEPGKVKIDLDPNTVGRRGVVQLAINDGDSPIYYGTSNYGRGYAYSFSPSLNQ